MIQPTLWHHDLSGSNIFISNDDLARGHISVTSVIDWQHTWVGPLYIHSRVPNVFCYHVPWKLPEGLQMASLPESMEQMSKLDQKAARDDVAAMNMEVFYRALVVQHAPYYYEALTDSYNNLFTTLARAVSSSWDGMFHIVSVHSVFITETRL
jgi:hypothetical protein